MVPKPVEASLALLVVHGGAASGSPKIRILSGGNSRAIPGGLSRAKIANIGLK